MLPYLIALLVWVCQGCELGCTTGLHSWGTAARQDAVPAASLSLHLLVPRCPSGFAWSWGPIVWLLGSEIQTMDTRTSGMSAGGGWVGWSGGLMAVVHDVLCPLAGPCFACFASTQRTSIDFPPG